MRSLVRVLVVTTIAVSTFGAAAPAKATLPCVDSNDVERENSYLIVCVDEVDGKLFLAAGLIDNDLHLADFLVDLQSPEHFAVETNLSGGIASASVTRWFDPENGDMVTVCISVDPGITDPITECRPRTLS